MAEIEKEVRENTVPEVDTGQEDFEEEDVVVDDNGEIPDEMLSRYGLFLRRLKEKFHHKQEGHRERHKLVSYAKYGYLFLIPFFISFAIFQLAPLIGTFVYSFTKYYYKLGRPVGPTFIGFENYVTVFTPTTTNDIVSAPQFFRYFGNTMIMWLMGFVPQIIISLLLAIWFTDNRLKLKGASFFKGVTYMPNLVMASAFGLLFQMLFSTNGPINLLFGTSFSFKDDVWWSRSIIAFINWLMWFGNTCILLMSGIMGIDESIFESARLDGSGAQRTFWHITLPLLMPIIVYVLITSLIGGIQLFDVVDIFTNHSGNPLLKTETLMMWLQQLIRNSKNYGLAGAVSVILFLVTGALSIFIFRTLIPNNKNAVKAEARARRKRLAWVEKGEAEVTDNSVVVEEMDDDDDLTPEADAETGDGSVAAEADDDVVVISHGGENE